MMVLLITPIFSSLLSLISPRHEYCPQRHVPKHLQSVCYLLIALMVEAVRTSETSVNFYETTRRNIAEGCHLHHHSVFFLLCESSFQTHVKQQTGLIQF
jgi:hypothetical protein